MRIAYLLYTYPALSQAFILREVRELRKLGVEVHPFSLRAAGGEDLRAVADREEAEITTALLPPDLIGLARAQLAAITSHPLAYLKTLLAAVREAGLAPRTLALQIANFVFAVLIWRRLAATGVRHVHTHFAGTPSHVASLVARFGTAADDRPWSWSMTVHGPVEFFDVGANRLRERASDATFVAYVSSFARDQLLVATDPADWEKLHLVRCGLNAADFDSPARDGREDGPLELLSVGRHVEVKAPHVLIHAVAELARRGRDIRLTMIGQGPLTVELERLAASLGVADRVILTGGLGQDDIPSYYEAADIFCMSSVAESLPVVLMEAMASGLPVISTDVGGIADLVEDGVNGLLVRPGDPLALADACESLCSDPQRRRDMGERGRRRVAEEFDIRLSARTLSKLFPQS